MTNDGPVGAEVGAAEVGAAEVGAADVGAADVGAPVVGWAVPLPAPLLLPFVGLAVCFLQYAMALLPLVPPHGAQPCGTYWSELLPLSRSLQPPLDLNVARHLSQMSLQPAVLMFVDLQPLSANRWTSGLPLQSLAFLYSATATVPFARHVALSMLSSALPSSMSQARTHLPAKRWWLSVGLAAQPLS